MSNFETFSAAPNSPEVTSIPLPPGVVEWFRTRGWHPRPYQLEVLEKSGTHQAQLVIAPPGAGKTLAGFLPVIVASARSELGPGLRCLYVSPLKALAVDIQRGLERPLEEMGLNLKIGLRTGDTPANRRARQFRDPPSVLLTTPEQLALMLSSPESHRLFADLDQIIVDEVHAIASNKRGDLLSLGLAQLAHIAPQARRIALSATVAAPGALLEWVASGLSGTARKGIVVAPSGKAPEFEILLTDERVPWSGYSARYAIQEIYARLASARLAIIFVNTRRQAELMFQMMWDINELNLRIALHHGSLDVQHRRRIEAAMAAGTLDAVVATSTLDLGIDWGDVDLVIQIGAPKGSSRLLQRVGRSRHRLDEASKAILVPANRFEWLECLAAVAAAGVSEQDPLPSRPGALDALAQHVVSRLASEPMSADGLFDEIRGAQPYSRLARATFDDVLQFATSGGYSLKAYERFSRIRAGNDGVLRVTNPRIVQAHRMNVGAITDSPVVRVRIARQKGEAIAKGREIGTLDSVFAATLSPGDSFYLGGEAWILRAQREDEVLVSRTSPSAGTFVPSYMGGRLPVSENLAQRVAAMMESPADYALPEQVRLWLRQQQEVSQLPLRRRLLIESFPWRKRHHLVFYPFAGRLALQTLGALLSRRMERMSLAPAGFLANDYALMLWHLRPLPADSTFFTSLLSPDILGEDVENFLEETSILRRAFRACAVVAGLVPRRMPGNDRLSRAVTVSSDLIFDVLRRHEPDHILLKAAREEASREMLGLDRLGQVLTGLSAQFDVVALDRPSPLAIPLLLEMGREKVTGEAQMLALETLAALDSEDERAANNLLRRVAAA